MEAKYWFYIVIGGIYLLSRFLKKPEPGTEIPQKGASGPANQTNKPGSPRPLTFEELLQEITKEKQSPKTYTPQPQPLPKRADVVDYDEDLKDEEEDLEDLTPEVNRKSSVSEAYEEGKRIAFNRPSLEETIKLKDTQMSFGKFKVFEQEEQRNLLEEYTKQLQDPEGLKKAVVMSEILNRKF